MTDARSDTPTTSSLSPSHGERAEVWGSPISTSPSSTPPDDPGPVRPSSRDPVQGWLDVFIPMTGLPRSRADEIRAELEDHLRARVDDLMITGQTEPDAVQRAVAELGETADLARQFRTALKPRRRPLMQTALIAAAGAALFFGVSTVTETTQPDRQDGAKAVHREPALTDAAVAVRGATFGDLFNALREQTDRPVLVHWDRLGEWGVEHDTKLDIDADRLPARHVLQILAERMDAAGQDPIAVGTADGLIEISNRSHFDARTATLVSYDVRDLIELKSGFSADTLAARGEDSEWTNAGRDLLITVASLSDRHIWDEFGGDTVRGMVSGATLLVEAPARVHNQIGEVLDILRADAARTRELARAEREEQARREAERMERRRLVNQRDRAEAEATQAHRRELGEIRRREHIAALEEEFERLTQSILKIQRWYAEVYEPSNPLSPFQDRDKKLNQEELSRLNAERNEHQIREKDLQIFRDSVRERLIALKYGELSGTVSPDTPASQLGLRNPEEFRRPDGTIDHESLRKAAIDRERARQAERQGQGGGDQAD